MLKQGNRIKLVGKKQKEWRREEGRRQVEGKGEGKRERKGREWKEKGKKGKRKFFINSLLEGVEDLLLQFRFRLPTFSIFFSHDKGRNCSLRICPSKTKRTKI